MFDLATNEWNPILNMKEARWGCAACAISDKLYVIGGQIDKDEGYLSSVEVFDTMSQKRSHFPSMTNK